MRVLMVPLAVALIPAFILTYTNVIPEVRAYDCGPNGMFCQSHKEDPIQAFHNLPQNDATDEDSHSLD